MGISLEKLSAQHTRPIERIIANEGVCREREPLAIGFGNPSVSDFGQDHHFFFNSINCPRNYRDLIPRKLVEKSEIGQEARHSFAESLKLRNLTGFGKTLRRVFRKSTIFDLACGPSEICIYTRLLGQHFKAQRYVGVDRKGIQSEKRINEFSDLGRDFHSHFVRNGMFDFLKEDIQLHFLGNFNLKPERLVFSLSAISFDDAPGEVHSSQAFALADDLLSLIAGVSGPGSVLVLGVFCGQFEPQKHGFIEIASNHKDKRQEMDILKREITTSIFRRQV